MQSRAPDNLPSCSRQPDNSVQNLIASTRGSRVGIVAMRLRLMQGIHRLEARQLVFHFMLSMLIEAVLVVASRECTLAVHFCRANIAEIAIQVQAVPRVYMYSSP